MGNGKKQKGEEIGREKTYTKGSVVGFSIYFAGKTAEESRQPPQTTKTNGRILDSGFRRNDGKWMYSIKIKRNNQWLA
jgi:hypothetical protein